MSLLSLAPFLVGCLFQADPGPAREHGGILTADEINGLRNSPTLESCVEALKRWKRAHAFEKLAFLEELGRRFSQDEERETLNYRWQEGTNDFKRLAGRINWALGEMLGVPLASVTPTTSQEELEKLSKEASRLVAAYRAGTISLAQERNEPPIEDLQRRYRDRIKPGITDQSTASILAMHDLLAEWFPIGKEARTLALIIGSEGQKEQDGVTYAFDSGFGGGRFQFAVKEGRIESLNILGLE